MCWEAAWKLSRHICILRAEVEADAGTGRKKVVANADAERTLLRLKQKLEGLEGGAHSR